MSGSFRLSLKPAQYNENEKADIASILHEDPSDNKQERGLHTPLGHTCVAVPPSLSHLVQVRCLQKACKRLTIACWTQKLTEPMLLQLPLGIQLQVRSVLTWDAWDGDVEADIWQGQLGQVGPAWHGRGQGDPVRKQ